MEKYNIDFNTSSGATGTYSSDVAGTVALNLQHCYGTRQAALLRAVYCRTWQSWVQRAWLAQPDSHVI